MTQDSSVTGGWIRRRDIPVIAGLVILSFTVENTIGLLLLAVVGIPLVGGMLSATLDGVLIFLGIFLVPRKPAAMIFAIVLLALSTLTPSFGPPGLYKVLIGVGLGMAAELILLLFGRKTWAYILAVAVAFGLSIPVTYFAWLLFNIPGIKELEPQIPLFTAIYTVLGAAGASLGAWFYHKRLAKYEIIRRLRGVQNPEDKAIS